METKQTFVYKPKMNYSDFYAAAAFTAAAAGCWYFQYGIRFKNLRLLDYPNSAYALGGLALVMLAWALVKFNKTSKAKKNLNPITVGASSFSFPYKDGMAEVAFSEIETVDKDNDDDNSLIVRAKGRNYEFFEAYFESEAKYAAFVELIAKR